MATFKMNYKSFSCIYMLICLLSACGGGGSSDGSSNSGSGSISTPVVVSKPAPFTMIPSVVSLTTTVGYQQTISVKAISNTNFNGSIYFKINTDEHVINSETMEAKIDFPSNKDYRISVWTLAALPAGLHSGYFNLSACEDNACTRHLEGSPFKVPYEIEVVPLEGGLRTIQLTPLKAFPGVKNWETLQGNPSHTGFVPMTATTSAISARWKWFPIYTRGMKDNLSTMATANGLIFITQKTISFLGNVKSETTAINESNGTKAWSFDFTSDLFNLPTNPPAVSGNKVFVVVGFQNDTAMYALDAFNGSQLFKSKMSSQWENYLAPTIMNGIVYNNGGRFGGLYAFDMQSGKGIFFQDLFPWGNWTPSVDSKYIYNSYTTIIDNSFTSFLGIHDAFTGTLISSIKNTKDNKKLSDMREKYLPVIIASEETVFAGDVFRSLSSGQQLEYQITNFDIKSKLARWSVRGGYSGEPAYHNGVLYVGNKSTSRLEAINGADGSLLWHWALPATDLSNLANNVLVINNLIFISSESNVYAIDRSTRQSVWTYPVAGALSISTNGILYVKGERQITAFNLQ